jgi:hypothetical protein
MKYLSSFLLIAFSLISLTDIHGQNNLPSRDKYVMLTMPYNQRPLTLYRGQVKANAGYKFAVRSQSFNEEGNLTYLKDNGTGSVYHYYYIELQYGLTGFMEVGAETSFLRRGIRDAAITTLSVTTTSTESVTVNKLTETKGMGDILLYSALRLPVEYHWFDFGIKGGIFLPSARSEALKPTNNVVTSLAAANTYTVNLHYNYTNGYVVPVYLIAAASKLSVRKFTAEAEWTMRTPMKEGTNIRWEEMLTEKVFSYNNKSYSYLLSDAYTFDASLHYQATGWFNIWMNTSFYKTRGGWTEYWGNRYINPVKRLVNLEPGFELQVSPSLTLYQVAGFPLSGKNNDAPFYLFTTLTFNLFPFLR